MYSYLHRKSNLTRALPLCIILITGPGTLSRQDIHPTELEYSISDKSEIRIIGTTNINNFTCFSNELFTSGKITFYRDESTGILTFSQAILKLRVRSLDCSNRGMNSDLNRTLNSGIYPDIIINLINAKTKPGFSFKPGNKTELIAQALITLAGKTQTADIYILARRDGPVHFRFSGDPVLLFSSFGISTPRALFGLIRVNDPVHIQFHLFITIHSLPGQKGEIRPDIPGNITGVLKDVSSVRRPDNYPIGDIP